MRRVGYMQAIKRAHEDVKPGVLQVSAGELLDANANRSPTAYLANPPEERARYKHNTDKTMTLLKVLDTEERQAAAFSVLPAMKTVSSATATTSLWQHYEAFMSPDKVMYTEWSRQETPFRVSGNWTDLHVGSSCSHLGSCYRGRGAVTWFPVHCTSINNTNTLISGDNKGVAAQFLEGWAAGAARNSTVGRGFVGAFGQANVGDTSPNVLGAFCQDTGMPACCLVEFIDTLYTKICLWSSHLR